MNTPGDGPWSNVPAGDSTDVESIEDNQHLTQLEEESKCPCC